MSSIIFSWLNDEIQLSKRISHIEEDFNNGYLFGELLQKYNQQLNFNQFQNKDDKKSKLKNFQLLFDTFAALGVTFNSNVANQIINKKEGAAEMVLYQLKMYLQKTTSNAFTKITKMTKTLSPLKKIKVSKQQYDNVSKEHFVKRLNELHPAQKTLNQQNLLKKFSDFHEKQKLTNANNQQKDIIAKQLEQKKFRQKQLDNLKKTSDFRNQWERSNLQKWSANMTVRKMQHQKDVTFKTKLQSSKFQNKTMAQLNAIKLLDKDISQFQKKNLGKNDSDSQNQSSDKLPQPLQSDTFTKKQSKLSAKLRLGRTDNSFLQSSLKKKKQPQATEQSKHQRQKKRRKMIVEQNKRYQLIQISRREKYIISTIQQTSKQQKQIQYQIWRVWQNRNIIKQNKTLTEEKEKEKEQTKQINNKFKKDELLKTYREEHQKQVSDGIQRQNKYFNDYKVSQRKKTYDQCKKMIQSFVEMTEKCFKYQQQSNKQQIQQSFLDHIFDQFIQGVSQQKDIAQLQLKNYIHGQGQWNLKIKKSQDIPSDPTIQNAIPQKVTNNYYLGNILKFLFEKFYLTTSSQQQIKNSSPQFLISLLGLQFSGKHIIAQMIKEQFNFNVIQIEKLILSKVNDFQNIKDKLSQVSTQTQELVDICLAGKQIPNRLIIKLLEDQVKKNPKSVLINYPITYDQAVDFTKAFGNVQPSDFIDPSQLQKKIQSFSRLVWPTQSKIIPKPRTECGLDFALWIDINPKASLDRFLGRRWIKDQVVHIRQNIAQKVDFLKTGEKGSSLILKNNQKIINMPKLKDWFEQFGIQITEEQQICIQKAWEKVNGQKNQEQLRNQVFLLVNRALQVKKKKLIKEQEKNIQKIQQQKINKQVQQKQAQIREMCIYSGPETIKKKLSQALNSMQIQKQFITTLCELWNKAQNQTVNSFKKVFTAFFNQGKQISNYISSMKKNYIQLLTREDSKFALVKQFQINYNNFFKQHPDMVFQEYTKDQLHQRVDDLEDELFNMIQEKKQDAIQQRKNIMESGWLQAQMDQFHYGVRILLQAQLSRFIASQKIISDFYSKKFMVPQKQYQQSAYQINYDTTLQSYTKQNIFPRLEKLISQTLRLFNKQEEVVEDKNKKGGKQPPKKDDKKQGKKGEVQQVKEPTPEQLQMKKAINTQKSIFRYRINVIQSFALQKLKNIKEQGQKLYTSIEDYYLYTYKIQNKCVLNLSKILRTKIQNQSRIQNEIQISYVDIIETQLIRNFQKEKPVVFPAKEKVVDDRFTIVNIKELMTWIYNESEGRQNISTRKAILLFQSFRNNEFSKCILAQKWKTLTQNNYQNFIRRIDPQDSGFIGLWKIIMFIIMTNFRLPQQKQLEQYANSLTQYGTVWQVNKQKFTSTVAWFDEQYHQQENVRLFERNYHIKNLLFDIFKTQNKGEYSVDGQKVIQSLSLKWLDKKQQILSGKTYFECAFQ